MAQILSWILCVNAIYMLLLISRKAEAKYAFVNGTVTIAGLFNIQTGKGTNCEEINEESVMTLEAIRWYINQLNENRALPFKIGFKGYNTCGSHGTAVETVLDVIYQHKEDENNNLIGFLSFLSNEQEKDVASVLSSFPVESRYLHISMSATANELKNATMYPDFYSVIPDDSKQLKAILLLMKELSWNRIGIIYEDTNDGRDLAFAFREHTNQTSICVSTISNIKISENGEVYPDQFHEALHEVLMFEPFIEGVVYFGDATIAKYVLQRSENEFLLAKLPVFILAGTVGLDNALFYPVGSSSPLKKSKGSFVVTPAYTNIKSFHDYWLSLFTDLMVLRANAASNSWLYDIFQTKSNTNCNPRVINCIPLLMAGAIKKFRVPTLHVQYGIIAAHTMATAIQQAFSIHCKSGGLACASELMSHYLIDSMRKIVIDFGTDFNVPVEPLTTSGYRMTFRNTSGPEVISFTDIAQVFNFRQLQTGEFGLLKVGSFKSNDELELKINTVKDYYLDGQEISYPNLRKGQCPYKKKCSECIPEDVQEQFIYIPGDVYVIGHFGDVLEFLSSKLAYLISIIGIAPVYNKDAGESGCGDIYLEGYDISCALKYGLEMFKNSQDYSEYRDKFGDRNIGLIILNSCRNDVVIIRKILDLHRYGIDIGNGSRIDLKKRVLGYIGAFTSDVSVRVAQTLKEINHVQISYSSTTPILSDKKTYPHVLRVVPADDAQVEAILQVVKTLGGEYVQVVYVEKEYGESAVKLLKFSAKKHNICVAQDIEVEQNGDFYKYYEMIRQKHHAKIVILFLHHPILLDFMRTLTDKMQVGTFQFIASDGWGKHKDMLDIALADGVISVALEIKNVDGLIPYIHNKTLSPYHKDVWLEQYLQMKYDCYFDFSFDKTYEKLCTNHSISQKVPGFSGDYWSNFATTSILALLMGSAELYRKRCSADNGLCSGFYSDLDALINEVKNISMDILGNGKRKLFDENGDGNIGYSIYNVQKNSSNNNALAYVKVGDYDLKKGLHLEETRLQPPLNKKILSPCPNALACKDCLPSHAAANVSGNNNDGPPAGPNIAVIVLACIVGCLGLALILVISLFSSKLVRMRKKKKHDSQYITPMEAQTTRSDRGGIDNYHDILLNEEPRL